MSDGALRRNESISSFSRGIASGLTEIFNGWVHLRHTHHVCDGTFCGDDTTECIGVLFAKLFKQYQSKLVEELILTALLDDNSKARSKISGLLTDLGTLVVETPEDR